MSRVNVVVPEKKEKIEKIKKKYKNMEMSDDAALKIKNLEVTNNILKTATAVAGVVTVVDFFVPDPVLGLDEAALTALTSLFGYLSSVVNNKIEEVANSGDMNIEMDEVTKLSEQISKAAKSVKDCKMK